MPMSSLDHDASVRQKGGPFDQKMGFTDQSHGFDNGIQVCCDLKTGGDDLIRKRRSQARRYGCRCGACF